MTAVVRAAGNLSQSCHGRAPARQPGPDPAGGRAGRDDGRASTATIVAVGQPGHPGAPAAPRRLMIQWVHQRATCWRWRSARCGPRGKPGRPVRAQEGVPGRVTGRSRSARRPSACPGPSREQPRPGHRVPRAGGRMRRHAAKPTAPALAAQARSRPRRCLNCRHRRLGRGHRRVHRRRADRGRACRCEHIGWEAVAST